MYLIYKNAYGAIYGIENAPNPLCTLQLVVDTVGIFMARDDLSHLLEIVMRPHGPCNCAQCTGDDCHKIWCSGQLFDICLKLDPATLQLLQELIQGTQFVLGVDSTLGKFHIERSKE
ncbi:MAG: hypothetical protein V7724_13235 [Sediminicola sp.]